MIDIFADDAFSIRSMTASANIVPYVPKRIGAMDIFKVVPENTPVAFIERKGTSLSLLPTKPRGSGETTKRPANRRDLLPIAIPYVPYDDAVLPSALSGIREFATEDQLESVVGIVTDRLTDMRASHEVTHEFHRIGAIKGIVVDADQGLTELVNLFDAFNISQEEFFFDLEGSGENIKGVCLDIIAYMEEVLGGNTYDHIHAFVGATFFRNLVMNEEIKTIYNEQTTFKWAAVQQGTGTMGRGTNQVTFGDITFECYRGKVGSVDFIDADRAHFFPVGVPDLFEEHYAPAETMTDVNTPGKVIYAQQQSKDWDSGMDIHTESNPLMICKRPKLLVLGHTGTEEDPS
jgi:hypothetical protein